MSVDIKRKFTAAEYLERERKAEVKSEFYKGEIFAMSGASRNHNVINTNFGTLLQNHLSGRGCQHYSGDMRLHIPLNTLYTYPDVMVGCGNEQFLDNDFDTLLNPDFIAEILSPATANYDMGGKFMLYRSIPSLKEYWTISSLEYRVSKHVRQDDGTWIFSESTDVQATVILSCYDLKVALADLYRNVKF